MRWDVLFGDLEAQLAAAGDAELAAEVEERTRHEQGSIELTHRLRASAGRAVVVGVDGGDPQRGVLTGVGPDWLLLGDDAGEVLLPLAAATWLTGLGRTADVTSPGQVWARLGLRAALRGIARDRAPVTLLVRGGMSVAGTVDRVGADHLDVAVHPLDEPRRTEVVRVVRTVRLAALLGLRRN